MELWLKSGYNHRLEYLDSIDGDILDGPIDYRCKVCQKPIATTIPSNIYDDDVRQIKCSDACDAITALRGK